MPNKHIKNPPGLRRPPPNPKGIQRKGQQTDANLKARDAAPGYNDPHDDPGWNWFLRIFAFLMVVAVIIVINNAYQYYKRPFVTHTVEIGDISTSVYARGVVEPKNIQKLINPLPDIAVVNAVNADVGDVVKRGSVVIEISDKILLSRMLETQHLVDYYTLNMKNALKYYDLGYADESDLAQNEYDLREVERRLDFYTYLLPQAKVKAKRSGRVLRRDVDPGDKIEPTQLLMWIGEPSPRWVMLEMQEQEVKDVKVGDKVRMYIGYDVAPRMKEYTYPGTVYKIVPPLRYEELRFEKETWEVYVELADEVTHQPESLTPVRAEIISRQITGVPWVQQRALYKETYVLVKDADGTVEARYVELGEKGHRGEKVEVITGVEEGEQVLTFPDDYVNRFGAVRLPGAG